MAKLFSEVYGAVKKIPEGKVATYGQIAKMVGTKDARKIGWALHVNKDPKCPCHRVVSKEGKLADNFALDGYKGQKRRLKAEGIAFKDSKKVDLKVYLWKKYA